MTMSDPLESAKFMLARARHHCADFKGQFLVYRDSDPITKSPEYDSKTDENVIKAKLVKPIPVALNGIASDAICNLRSTLDQASYAVCLAAGGQGKDTYFPFGDTEAEVKNRHAGGSKEIPANVFALMESFKPYKGGDDLLWALNKLSNANKHRILVPVAARTGDIKAMDFSSTGNGNFRIAMNPEWNDEKNEVELGRVKRGDKFKLEVKIDFFVAFGEVSVIAGEPAGTVLNALASKVDCILKAVEAESRKIGLFS